MFPAGGAHERYSVCTACVQRVHSMCTACAHAVHSMCTACAHAVQCIYALHQLLRMVPHAVQVLSRYWPGIYWLIEEIKVHPRG